MTPVRLLFTAVFLLTLSTPEIPLAAQNPAAWPASPASAVVQTSSVVPASAPTTPSAILRPALDSLQQALALLRTDKWKAPSAITAESTSDVGSIQRDLDRTLPPILASADAAPNSVAQLLPAYRNIEALYDVLVRVTQTSVLAAPAQQSTALQQATSNLQQARRNFGDLLDSTAQSQDRKLHDVQARLTTLQATPPPPAPVCPPPPPVKKTKPHSKAKPATSQTAPQ